MILKTAEKHNIFDLMKEINIYFYKFSYMYYKMISAEIQNRSK